MSRSRKLLLSTLVVGATGAVAGLGVFAAFTATTQNTGNSITAGTVQITDNDATQALYVQGNAGPGNTYSSCIRVTYGGSLDADVKLYRLPGAITNGDQFQIRVERGSGLSGAFPSCAGFVAAGTIFATADLNTFPTTYAAGIDAKGSVWTQNSTQDYRFTVTVKDDPTPNARATPLGTGSHGFQWEARNVTTP